MQDKVDQGGVAKWTTQSWPSRMEIGISFSIRLFTAPGVEPSTGPHPSGHRSPAWDPSLRGQPSASGSDSHADAPPRPSFLQKRLYLHDY